jgi:hypothetical protein
VTRAVAVLAVVGFAAYVVGLWFVGLAVAR